MATRRLRILVCRGTECGEKRGSARVHTEFENALKQPPAGVEVSLGWQSCFGQCRRGINVLVKEMKPGEDPFFSSFLSLGGPGSALYHAVLPEEVPRIIEEHVVGGKVILEFKKRGADK
ncbi:MAG TPA: (2Fe-2S) ferredoxin domain-containing protein [Polyangia bacterium]|jgi:(2Fe-2S) ferredoxin|nr:(2Fe-2S) ferredoxin domain-containing protein [Polyangia bacterium]